MRLLTFKKQTFRIIALLLLAAPAIGQEPWTDSLRGKEGIFAVRAEPGFVLVIRADDRAGRTSALRVKILREGASPLTVNLRRLDGDHAPWRYAGAVKDWDGSSRAIELEVSDNGNSWRNVGVFRAP